MEEGGLPGESPPFCHKGGGERVAHCLDTYSPCRESHSITLAFRVRRLVDSAREPDDRVNHPCLFVRSFVFFVPFVILALLSSPSLPVVVQIRGRIAGPPPPSLLRYVPSVLSREYCSIFFPRRLASNCAYPRC